MIAPDSSETELEREEREREKERVQTLHGQNFCEEGRMPVAGLVLLQYAV